MRRTHKILNMHTLSSSVDCDCKLWNDENPTQFYATHTSIDDENGSCISQHVYKVQVNDIFLGNVELFTQKSKSSTLKFWQKKKYKKLWDVFHKEMSFWKMETIDGIRQPLWQQRWVQFEKPKGISQKIWEIFLEDVSRQEKIKMLEYQYTKDLCHAIKTEKEAHYVYEEVHFGADRTCNEARRRKRTSLSALSTSALCQKRKLDVRSTTGVKNLLAATIASAKMGSGRR